jgi:O-antigen/teichoic acid export membrane protein
MPALSRTRNYLYGLSTGYTVTLVTILVGLWLTPFTLRYLDREAYAVFALASDLLMWLGLLDLGISAGLNVQVAKLTGNPDQAFLNQLASTAMIAQAVVAAGMLIIGFGMAVFFPIFFNVRADLQQSSTQLMALLVVGAAINVASQTFSSLLVAHQQVYIDNLIRLSLIGLRTVLTVLLLTAGLGLVALGWANLTAIIVTSTLAVLRVRRLLPGLQIRLSNFSKDALRGTGSLGIWFSLGGLAGIVIYNLDRVVTGKVVSIQMVTTLVLTSRIYLLSGGLLQQVTNTARPMLGQFFGANQAIKAQQLYRQLFLVSTGGAVVVAASLWAGNEKFVSWWVGLQNYGGMLMDTVLALNLILFCWVLPNRATLASGIAYVPQHAIARVIEGTINLALSVFLGFRFGVLGVLLGTTIACLLTSIWYLPVLTARMFGQSLRSLVLSDTGKIFIVLLLMIPVSIGVKEATKSIDGFIGAAITMISTFIIGLMLLWFVGFDTDLRQRIGGLSLQLVHRIRRIA